MDRVKFAIDANESPALKNSWHLLFPTHEFIHVNDLGLSNDSDIELFDKLPSMGFHAFITRDRAQLKRPDELHAIKASGLSWIGHKEPAAKGPKSLAIIVASYSIALPNIIDILQGSPEPLRFNVKLTPHGPGQTLNAFRLSDSQKIPLR